VTAATHDPELLQRAVRAQSGHHLGGEIKTKPVAGPNRIIGEDENIWLAKPVTQALDRLMKIVKRAHPVMRILRIQVVSSSHVNADRLTRVHPTQDFRFPGQKRLWTDNPRTQLVF
jgi:hypothetical protein